MNKQQQSKFQLFDFAQFDEICLIDDEPAFLFLNDTIFKITHPNIKRVSIHNIKDAFKHLTSQPDARRLVVLDIHIGLTTGFELLDELNALSLINTKVIIHSTYHEDDYVRKALSYSLVKAFVVKPLSIEMVELISGEGELPANLHEYDHLIRIKK